jgi:ABC-type antimicrobial peptide transport system permease subunit
MYHACLKIILSDFYENKLIEGKYLMHWLMKRRYSRIEIFIIVITGLILVLKVLSSLQSFNFEDLGGSWDKRS